MTNILSFNQITTKIAALVGVVALVVIGLLITSVAQAQTQQRTFNEEWEIRDFVNSLNRFTRIPDANSGRDGAVFFDDISARKVCELAGLPTVVSKTAGSYSSPGDNTIAYWDAGRNDFVVVPAPQRNVFIDKLTCEGQVTPPQTPVNNPAPQTPVTNPVANPAPAATTFDISYTGPQTAKPGNLVTYAVNIRNISGVVQKNVHVFVNFATISPNGSQMFISSLSDCVVGTHPKFGGAANGVNCFVGELQPGLITHVQLIFKVLPTASCGLLTNVVDVGADGVSVPSWAAHTLTVEGCGTSTPVPATPTPTPNPTATPTPKPEVRKELDVEKSDNKDVIRPGHELTYVITVKNGGNQDIDDLRVSDTVPGKLTVISIGQNGSLSASSLVWSNVKLGAGETKDFTFKAIVKTDTPNNYVLRNKVVARSNDHDLTDEASDTTLVKHGPAVAASVSAPASIVSVPVTARTGAGSAAIAIMTSLAGAAGLITTIRKAL
ncbi:MAG: DUF11 domain-containing protein [Candidatus Andersenbacteria bacterium]|nr:DUF11 domain-containing protein [Candidatus Andersenbacteria bacterium]